MNEPSGNSGELTPAVGSESSDLLGVVIKWWGPLLLAVIISKFTSLIDGGRYRWAIHSLLMIQGIVLWEMARDFDRIQALFHK